MRKYKQIKRFNDKYQEESYVNINDIEQEIYNYIKKEHLTNINHKILKEVLCKLNLYKGVFYVSSNEFTDLPQSKEVDNDNFYEKHNFQKVYVLNYFNDTAIVAIAYNDYFCKYIIDKIDTKEIYLQGNIAIIKEEE